MTIKKLFVAAVLSVAGLAATADRASAQVTLGPNGVQIGGQSGGRGLYVPYQGGVKNAAVTTPNGFAYQPSTGTVYSPQVAQVYQTPSGVTYGSSPSTSYYAPATSNFAPATSYYTPSGQAYSYPANTVAPSVVYPNGTRYYSNPAPVYSPAPVGTVVVPATNFIR